MGERGWDNQEKKEWRKFMPQFLGDGCRSTFMQMALSVVSCKTLMHWDPLPPPQKKKGCCVLGASRDLC